MSKTTKATQGYARGPAGMNAVASPNPSSVRQGTPYKQPGPGIVPRNMTKIPARSDPMQAKPTLPQKPRIVDPKPDGPGRGGRAVVTHPTRGANPYLPPTSPKR
jgi:hypothetical protein